MRKSRQLVGSIVVLVATLSVLGSAPRSAEAASAKEIDAAVDEALKSLYASTPAAVELDKIAKGILVFPQVVKGGFILGAEFGNGALRKQGEASGYYNTIGASYGFQAGVESSGYAFFFDKQGLMAGLSLQGSKISRITPDP